MSDTDRPVIEVTIAAPVDTVWQALRDRDQLRQWHGWESDADGGLDNEIATIFFTDVTEDAATRTLHANGGDTFVVEAVPGGALLRLVRAPRGDDPEWDAYYDDITQGWISFTQQLRFAVERQLGNVRRTLFFSAVGTSPLEAFGLGRIASLETGKPYEAELAGRPVTGEVWFRTDQQLGLTVDAWGEGLLVVAHQTAKSAAMVILNTYGLSDAEYEALRDAWTVWWTQRYST